MAAWTKTLPDGAQPLRVGDDAIRTNNDALEERLAQEHYFPDNSDSARWGRHKFGVYATAAARDAAITSAASGNLVVRTDLGRLQFHDGTNWAGQGVMVGTLAARPTADATAVAEGELYWASDDQLLYVHEQSTPAWREVPIVGSTVEDKFCVLSVGSGNLAKNADVQIEFDNPETGEGFAFPGADGVKDYLVTAHMIQGGSGGGASDAGYNFHLGPLGTNADPTTHEEISTGVGGNFDNQHWSAQFYVAAPAETDHISLSGRSNSAGGNTGTWSVQSPSSIRIERFRGTVV